MIKKYYSNKDSTITNAFKDNLTERATQSNMGESDILEVFSLKKRVSDESSEISRILIDFPIEDIISDRQKKELPPSGSVKYFLRMFNAEHRFSLPKKYHLSVNPLSSSWEEGIGIDMNSYKDEGAVNWLSSSAGTLWENEGSDYYEDNEKTVYFENGTEDINLDVTDIVESWISGTLENNGLVLKLSCSYEDDASRSYFTKKFFSRGTQNFFKKPLLEARFDDSIKDDRGNFYKYTSFVSEEDNVHTLYFYNKFKGKLYDHPALGTNNAYVRMYADTIHPSYQTPLYQQNGDEVVTASWVSTGIYKVDVSVNTSLETIYDFWFSDPVDINSVIGYGGSVEVKRIGETANFSSQDYNFSIKNLKHKYTPEEKARFQVFVREADWNPNSYTSVTTQTNPLVIEKMYYSISRVADNLLVVPFHVSGDNEIDATRLSFDVNGNYFDFDMSILESGYTYAIKFRIVDVHGNYDSREQFKFRVEE